MARTGDGEENVVTAGMFVHESADVIDLWNHLSYNTEKTTKHNRAFEIFDFLCVNERKEYKQEETFPWMRIQQSFLHLCLATS